MSIVDAANLPVERSLGGKIFKVKRLSIKQLFGISETKIINDCNRDIDRIAKTLTGKEKIDYLLAAGRSIPKGSELSQLATEYSQSPSGLSDLLLASINNEYQKVEESELAELLLNSTQEEQVALMSYISGMNQEEVKGVDNGDKKK